MDRYEDIKALNWSSLREMERSPKAFAWRAEHPREDTAAFALGRAVHCAVLEPAEFSRRYATPKPMQCAATTKKGDPCSHSALPFADHCGVHGGQGEADVWRLEHPGVEVISAEDGETIELCVAAVRAHADASSVLRGLQTEHVIEWTIDGVACKGRLDGTTSDRIVDLKTTSKGLASFPADVARLCYHGQLAWYRDGAIAAGQVAHDARAYIVAVETVPPYDVAALEIAGAELEAGRNLCRQLLAMWVECREANIWPGRYPALTRLELPRWAPGSDSEAGVW